MVQQFIWFDSEYRNTKYIKIIREVGNKRDACNRVFYIIVDDGNIVYDNNPSQEFIDFYESLKLKSVDKELENKIKMLEEKCQELENHIKFLPVVNKECKEYKEAEQHFSENKK